LDAPAIYLDLYSGGAGIESETVDESADDGAIVVEVGWSFDISEVVGVSEGAKVCLKGDVPAEEVPTTISGRTLAQ
jgi:hypothetical protein